MTQIHPEYSPDHSQRIGRGGAGARAEVNDHGSKTLATIAVIAGSMALGGLLVGLPLGLVLVDSRIEARMAPAASEAHLAETHALLATDRMMRTRAELEARGYLKQENH